MKVRYLNQARQDIAWWRIYYRTAFPEGRNNAKKHFLATEALLKKHPFAGTKLEKQEGRRLNIPRTPFAFIYHIVSDEIEIVRVYDMRQEGSDGFHED